MTTATTTLVPTGTWQIDPVHSAVGFAVKHLGISTFRGSFSDVAGKLTGGEQPSLEGTVAVESISIKQPDQRAHLLSPEFFDIERNPEIRFVSAAFRNDGDELVVEGDLTIRGVTQSVEARGSISEPGVNAGGAEAIALELETVVDRTAYGLGWNMELPGGKKALAEDVRLTVELELVKDAS